MSSTPRPARSGVPTTDPDLRATMDSTRNETPSAVALEGRYELYELLSQGGMGAVYRARHRQLDRSVAIKFMSAELRDDPEMRRRFSVEARVASSLAHPNIVTVTDFGIDAELGYFLVMELLTGQTLRARLDDHGLRTRVACDIIEQAAWALRYIHSRDIFHCDLKPENIFLVQSPEESRRRNHVKLIDFGLAFRSAGQPVAVSGTPPYLAPERLRGAPPSAQADLYSLGALFFELLTGRTPFQGNLTEVIDQQLRGELPPPPSSLTPETLETRTDEVILRALSPRPEDRPQSIESFLFELRTLMSMMGMRVRRVTRLSSRNSAKVRPPDIVLQQTPVHSKRAHQRVPLVVPVLLHQGGSFLAEGRTENLSKGGAFINLTAALELGAEVEVALPIAGDRGDSLMARAVVRWQRPATDPSSSEIGCGLEWLDPSDTLRFCLGRVIELASHS